MSSIASASGRECYVRRLFTSCRFSTPESTEFAAVGTLAVKTPMGSGAPRVLFHIVDAAARLRQMIPRFRCFVLRRLKFERSANASRFGRVE
jgi:hypothetical protein